MAALHMPYTVEPPREVNGGPDGWMAARDEMLRIQPRRRSRMPGSTRCASSKVARTCTSNITWKCRSGKVEDRLEVGDRGVVHQHVDRSELPLDRFDDARAVGLFGQVGGDR